MWWTKYLILLAFLLSSCYPGSGVSSNQYYWEFNEDWIYHSNSQTHYFQVSDGWWYAPKTGNSYIIFK